MTGSQISEVKDKSSNDGDVFSSLHNEINRVFDNFARGTHWSFQPLSVRAGKLSPRIDISETDEEIEVVAELPGVADKDVDVSLSGDMLTIRGEKQSKTDKEEKNYRIVERSHGSFERMTRLPCEVEAEKVKAVFRQGELTITLPKTERAKNGSHKIEITSQ